MSHFTNRILLCAFTLLLASCHGLGILGYDNPEVRNLQKESLAGFPKRPIQGETIQDYCEDRVAQIAPAKGEEARGGRAAALTNDGYYLTAWHVVSGEKFFLYNNVLAVTKKGRLAGIVSKAYKNIHISFTSIRATPRTSLAMIANADLEEIIATDRATGKKP
jgi:hypothetical protein